MNAFDVILDLGTWAKAHSAEVMVGAIAIPAAMGLGTYLLRTNQPLGSTVHGSRAGPMTTKSGRPASMVRTAWSWGASLGGSSMMMGRGMSSSSGHAEQKRRGRHHSHVAHLARQCPRARSQRRRNYDVTAKWRSRQAHNRIAYFTPCRSPHACINVGDTIRFKTPGNSAMRIPSPRVSPPEKTRENSTSLHFRELAARS